CGTVRTRPRLPRSGRPRSATTSRDKPKISWPYGRGDLYAQREQAANSPLWTRTLAELGVRPGLGDTAGALTGNVDRGPDPVVADELLDRRIVGESRLQLVAPGLQRDRLVEPRIRAHEHVRLVADQVGQLGNLVGRQVRPVGDPHRAIGQA